MEGVPDGLKELFFELGKKKGLSEDLLSEVLIYFVKNQYVKQGDDSSMMFGWEGTINNMSATPTLSVFFKL